MEKRKIFGFVFCTMCLIVQLCIGGPAQKVNAEGTVTTLEAGTTYSLSFSSSETPHMYFIMPEKGYFYYEITPTYYTVDGKVFSEGDDLFSFYSLKVEMVVNTKRYESESVYGGKTETSRKYAFKKGTKVDIFIPESAAFAYGGGSERSLHYDIKVTVVKPKDFEKENNNSKKAANTVKKGKTYTGLIMLEDTDYYVFKAPKTGKYKITATVSSAERDVDDLDAEVWKGTKRLSRTSMRYGKGYKSLWKGKLKKGQKIYIKFSGPKPLFFNGDLMYKLKIK